MSISTTISTSSSPLLPFNSPYFKHKASTIDFELNIYSTPQGHENGMDFSLELYERIEAFLDEKGLDLITPGQNNSPIITKPEFKLMKLSSIVNTKNKNENMEILLEGQEPSFLTLRRMKAFRKD